VSKDGVNRNWIFRYELDGERHDMGLGPLHTVGLADARQMARELRNQLLNGIDPLEARNEARAKTQTARAHKAKAQTFRQCAETYFRSSS
jgi:hypothetical protein